MLPGLGRDDSAQLTRRPWLFGISLGSNIMMSLALKAVELQSGAVETLAGLVLFGVPHRGSKMVTLFMCHTSRRCHRS